MNELKNWYYTKGQGMLLTESSQKLYHNYKKALNDFGNHWADLKLCSKCAKNDEVRGECSNDFCKKRECKFCKIKLLTDMGSGFRTNLLKDIGTREELKKPSPYYDIYIKRKYEETDLEIDVVSEPYKEIVFVYFFIGNQSKELEDEVVYIIKNLDKNKTENIKREPIYKLKPGEKRKFRYDLRDFDTIRLKPGNYSLKIVADTISSEQTFNVVYEYDSQDKVKTIKIQF